jgi:hypothetical protein
MDKGDEKTNQGTGESANAAKPEFFERNAIGEAIHVAFMRHLARTQSTIMATYMPPENVQRYRHGGSWRNPGANDDRETGMQVHSAQHAVGFDDVVGHDLPMINRFTESVTDQFHQQFALMFYSTIGEAAESVGNTVDAAGMAPEEAFYNLLEAVEVSADPDGSIRWPEFRGGGDFPDTVAKAVEAAGPEYRARLETLVAAKTEKALAKEAERKTRFARYGR